MTAVSKADPSKTTGHTLCRLEAFVPALKRTLEHQKDGTLERAGGLCSVVATFNRLYSETSSSTCIAAPAPPAWGPSRRSPHRPLVVNLGQGSTGTRFLHCVAEAVGLRASHGPRPRPHHASGTGAGAGATGSMPRTRPGPNPPPQKLGSWTDMLDALDYVSDSPVPYKAAAILASHPGSLAAPFLSLRDPWEWAVSRRKHADIDRKGGVAHGGCAVRGVRLHDDDGQNVAREVLARDAWALCAASRGERREPPFLVNLFLDPPDEAASRFGDFLAGPGRLDAAVANATVAEAWGKCKHQSSQPKD